VHLSCQTFSVMHGKIWQGIVCWQSMISQAPACVCVCVTPLLHISCAGACPLSTQCTFTLAVPCHDMLFPSQHPACACGIIQSLTLPYPSAHLSAHSPCYKTALAAHAGCCFPWHTTVLPVFLQEINVHRTAHALPRSGWLALSITAPLRPLCTACLFSRHRQAS